MAHAVALAQVQTLSLPLAGGQASHIRSDGDRARVLRELMEQHGVPVLLGGSTADRRRSTFAATPRSIARTLRGPAANHIACALGGGTPMLLYLTRASPASDAGACIMISRRVAPGQLHPRMAFVRLAFDDDAFDGTVVEGELLAPNPASSGAAASTSSGEWVFAVSDLLVDAGRRLEGTVPLSSRLAALANLVGTRHYPDDHDLFCVRCKRHMTLPEVGAVVRHAATHPDIVSRWKALLFKSPSQCGAPTYVYVLGHKHAGGPASGRGSEIRNRDRTDGRGTNGGTNGGEELDDWYDDEAVDVDDELTEVPASACAEPPAPARRAFWVRRTHLPDVYELHDTREGAARSVGDGQGGVIGPDGQPMTAGVPSLQASQALAHCFAGAAAGQDVRCVLMEHSARFNKWVACIDAAASATGAGPSVVVGL